MTERAPKNRNLWIPLALVSLAVNAWLLLRHPPARPGEEAVPGPAEEAAVEPEPFTFDGVSQVALTGQREVVLRFDFSEPPDLRFFRRHVSVSPKGETGLAYEILGESTGRTVLVRTGRGAADTLGIVVEAGLRAANRPEALAETVQTNLAVEGVFVLTGVETESESFAQGELTASFTVAPKPESAPDHVEITPKVPYTIAARHSWHGPRLTFSGAFQPGGVYTIAFRRGLEAVDGQALTNDVVRHVQFPDRPPALAFAHDGRYLSPRGSMQVQLSVVNHSALTVDVTRVHANNLVFHALLESGRIPDTYTYGRGDSEFAEALGESVTTRVVRVPVRHNEPTPAVVDLRELAGPAASGAYLVTARAGDDEARRLVVATDLGLTAKHGPLGMLVWVNRLREARPAAGAIVRVYSAANQKLAESVTDDGGVAALELPADPVSPPFVITAELDGDLSYLKLDGTQVHFVDEEGERPYLDRGYEAFVYTECGVYRPGESGHARALVRGPDLACPAPFPVVLRVVRPDGRVHRELPAMLSNCGTAEFALDWPAFLPTGRYTLELAVPGGDRTLGQTDVAVEDFVPPQVVAELRPESPRMPPGRDGVFRLSARHLFGRAGSGLAYQSFVSFAAMDFAPTNWPGFTFRNSEREFSSRYRSGDSGRLDAEGRGTLTVAIPDGLTPPSAARVVVSATVTEPSGRPVSASASARIDPYPFYVGLRPQRSGTGRVGDPAAFDVAAVLPDGAPAADVKQATCAVHRVTWSSLLRRNADGTYSYVSERVLTPVTSAVVAVSGGRAKAAFVPPSAGEYRVQVNAPGSGAAATALWTASSPNQQWVDWSMERPEGIKLVADRKVYVPGDTARLMVQAPFAGTALLTLETDRVLERRVVVLTNNSAELEIAVPAAAVPNIHACLTMVRAVDGRGVWSAHRATGSVSLPLDPSARRIALALEAPATMRPASPLKVRVRAALADGAPAAGVEVALAAVDVGICRLTDFAPPDPLEHFFAPRTPGVDLYDIYGQLMPVLEDQVARVSSAGGGDASELRRRLNPVRGRRFKPVVLWGAGTTTGPDGAAEFALEVPEFTGALALMAVGADRGHAGFGSATTTVKRALVVEPALPRFLAPGDVAEASLTLFNEGAQPMSIRLGARTAGPLELAAAPPETLALAAGQSTSLTFRLRGGAIPGTGLAMFLAETGDDRYQETIELPVRPATPLVMKSGFGTIAASAAEALAIPTNWMAAPFDATVWCSSGPDVRRLGPVDRLLHYPYGCLEQTVSASFPLLYLADLSAVVFPGRIGTEETKRHVEAGVLRVLSMQRAGGRFAWWPGTIEEYPWGSIYASHFLAEAARAGYAVPADRLGQALGGLQDRLEERVRAADPDSEGWQDDMQERAYACHVLALAGRPNAGWIARLLEQAGRLRAASRAHLAAACLLAGRPRDAEALLAVEPPPAAAPRDSAGCLNSPVRDVALLLDAWLAFKPDAPQVAVLAGRLDAALRDSAFRTTQEDAWCALALGKYARLRGAPPPLRGTLAVGARATPLPATNAYRAAWSAAEWPVRLANGGKEPAYYAWRVEGLPVGEAAAEADHDLAVRRTFHTFDGRPRGPAAFAAGELAVVRLDLDTQGRVLDNVVVEDLLPAGLEIENPALEGSAVVPWVKEQSRWYRSRDIRDDRLILFTGPVSGTNAYFYAVRAVTPGRYVLPPVTASCMYEPAIRSTHGGGAVEIKP